MEIRKVTRHQQVPFDLARSYDFAKTAFLDARIEIVKRLELRSNLIATYLVGSLTIFGAILTFSTSSLFSLGSFPIEICIVAPLFGLIVSFQLRSHVETTEDLAEFIRRDLNPHLMQLGAWSPYWDFSSREPNSSFWSKSSFAKSEKKELKKTELRKRSDLFAIHAPTLFSVLASLYIIYFDTASTPFHRIVIGSLCVVMFYFAINNTWKGYKYRELTIANPILFPNWWGDLMKEETVTNA